MSFDRKIVSGIFWVFLSTLASRVLSFLSKIILLKLLIPEDFGIAQTAFLALESLQLLREFGFSSALIYRKQDIAEAADVTFWITNLTSLVYAAIAFFGAPLIAVFFNDPRITPVVQVLAFTLLIRSPGTVHFVLLAKELDFKRKVLPDVIPTVGYGILAIVLGVLGFGVWALVWGKILEAILGVILVWLVVPYRPAFRFNTRIAREMFNYGMHLVVSQILIFAITNVDDAFVGRMAGMAALGVYGIAYLLSNIPATQITALVNQVMFPAFARLQDDLPYFRLTFFRTVRFVSLLSVPVAILTIFFAADFIHVLDPVKWGDAVLPIQLLAVYGLCRSVAANMGNVFKGGGKPQWLTYIALWRLATMLIFLYPAVYYWGVVGVSALSAIVAVVDWFISAWLCNKVIGASLRMYGRLLLPALAFAILSAAITFGLRTLLFGEASLLSLLFSGAVAMTLYAGLTLAADSELRSLAQRGLVQAQGLWNQRRPA
ncbi:MAG: lipopolysaccharide biosynthesis protein [Anaerolineae bacterium]